MEKFEKDMVAFAYNQHSSVLNYLSLLGKRGYSLGDVKRYVEWKRDQLLTMNNATGTAIPLKKCPECSDGVLKPLPVNTAPGNQTGDDSKIVYTCMNQNCMNQMFE